MIKEAKFSTVTETDNMLTPIHWDKLWIYNVILRAEKGETYNSIKNRYSLGFLEETDLGSKMEIEFQTDSFEILSKQLIEYGSGIEIVQPDELKCITRKHLAQITNHCLNLI